jgi:hypothetical protein
MVLGISEPTLDFLKIYVDQNMTNELKEKLNKEVEKYLVMSKKSKKELSKERSRRFGK